MNFTMGKVFKLFTSLILVLLIGCTQSVEGRMVSVAELSRTEWTQVSEECYQLLVVNLDVVGMKEGDSCLLMLITREPD